MKIAKKFIKKFLEADMNFVRGDKIIDDGALKKAFTR